MQKREPPGRGGEDDGRQRAAHRNGVGCARIRCARKCRPDPSALPKSAHQGRGSDFDCSLLINESVFTNQSKAAHSFASSKSTIQTDAPAFSSTNWVCDVITPTVGIPAAQELAIPVGESSNATQR